MSAGASTAVTPPPGALILPQPVLAVRAVLTSGASACCAGVTVTSATPVQALCGALAASGVPDSAMQVVDAEGCAVMLVESIHQAARDGLAGVRRAKVGAA